MSSRLLLIAHAPTDANRTARFAQREDPIDPWTPSRAFERHLAGCVMGSEHRCAQTVSALGVSGLVEEMWDDIDVGTWAGQSLEAVAAAHGPEAVMQWLSDSAYDAHGGESVEVLAQRVGSALAEERPPGLTLVVTSPSVLRAAVVAVLGAPTAAHRQVSAGPLDGVELTRERDRWCLRRMQPGHQWLQTRDVSDDGDRGRG